MNNNWIDFLTSQNATVSNNSEIDFPDSPQEKTGFITAVAYLGIIKISGKDAAIFLQGQLTCNIDDLNESNSFFTALCNAKGRVISTLLIVKIEDAFLLLLPNDLIDKVAKKLRMYILRSKVQLENVTDELLLLGVCATTINQYAFPSLPVNDFSQTKNNQIIIKLPSSNARYLIISSVLHAISLWKQLELPACNTSVWNYLDISAGLPWLTQATSETYIPQMLNIDTLGGISFNKGCYTGQEIIARTHYLGKAKRQMFLAECNITAMLNTETEIISDKNGQPVGKILSIQADENHFRLLIILAAADSNPEKLMLDNSNREQVRLIELQ